MIQVNTRLRSVKRTRRVCVHLYIYVYTILTSLSPPWMWPVMWPFILTHASWRYDRRYPPIESQIKGLSVFSGSTEIEGCLCREKTAGWKKTAQQMQLTTGFEEVSPQGLHVEQCQWYLRSFQVTTWDSSQEMGIFSWNLWIILSSCSWEINVNIACNYNLLNHINNM